MILGTGHSEILEIGSLLQGFFANKVMKQTFNDVQIDVIMWPVFFNGANWYIKNSEVTKIARYMSNPAHESL